MNKDQRLNLATLNLSGTAANMVRGIEDIRDFNFLALGLSRMPIPLQTRVAREYITMYGRKSGNATINANKWLRRTIEKGRNRFSRLFTLCNSMPLPWHIIESKERTQEHAIKIALDCSKHFSELAQETADLSLEESIIYTYEKLGEFCLTMNVTPKYWHVRDQQPVEALEISLLKILCEDWWKKKLKTVRKQFLEHIELAMGSVGKATFYVGKGKKVKHKNVNPYTSKKAQREFAEDQRSGLDYLSKLEIENEDGVVIDLLEAVKAGIANPAIRRCETMLRLRESEEIATELGFVSVFYTLTCPSKYHPGAANWNGATPKESQKYMVETWARARAKLGRLGVMYFGMRVAEAHADGCPHWHMMLFVPKKKEQTVTAIIRKHFISEDREELIKRYDNRRALFKAYKLKRRDWGHKKSQGIKAKEPSKDFRTFSPRVLVERIDPSKGSATGYIAKYISKNLDAYQITDLEDEETGEKIKVNPVLCWASTWGIRQFQFQGSPSVTVYRELRRQRDKVDHAELEEIREAADRGSWKDFVKLMGGMCVGRNANFKTAYEQIPFGNKYGELTRKIKGVTDSEETVSLLTRVTLWIKQLKGTAAKNAQELGFVGESDLSWTSGNNCTPLGAAAREARKLFSLGLGDHQVNELRKGKRVKVDDRILSIEDQKLSILEDENQIDLQKRNEIDHWAHIFARTEGRNRPFEQDWSKSREMVATAFVKANNEDRAMPIGCDWVYAREIVEGETEADWWDAGLMRA